MRSHQLQFKSKNNILNALPYPSVRGLRLFHIYNK